MVRSIWTIALLTLVAGGQAQAQEPIVAAADVGYPPFAMAAPSGGFEGLDIDIAKALSKKLGREIKVIDQPWSATIPGLNSKKFDMILAPATITKERAEGLLYAEGYGDALYGFVMRSKDAKVSSPEGFKGKVMATNKGNVFDRWLTEREAEFGWTINRYDKYSDAAAAVAVGQADAAMMYAAAAGWLAKQNPQLALADYVIDTGLWYGYAFRLEDKELRNQVDAALECLKKDGTIAALFEKWTGLKPPATGMSVTTVAGYGPEGFANYDPTAHEAQCK